MEVHSVIKPVHFNTLQSPFLRILTTLPILPTLRLTLPSPPLPITQRRRQPQRQQQPLKRRGRHPQNKLQPPNPPPRPLTWLPCPRNLHCRTVVQNKQESRRKCWVTRSSVLSFTGTALPCLVCLCAQLRSFTHSLAHSLPSSWISV